MSDPGGGRYITWSPIRRLMKKNGATVVARDAVDELITWLWKSSYGCWSSCSYDTNSVKLGKALSKFDSSVNVLKILKMGCKLKFL